MEELLIGITIGLAVGVLITVLSVPKNIDGSFDFDLMDDDDQVHESGFIDIPVQRIISQQNTTNNKKMMKIRKRINQFKNRNRFYK